MTNSVSKAQREESWPQDVQDAGVVHWSRDVEEVGWARKFPILSYVDLDFVIGQQMGWPIGMMRSSPPEFRRRVLAAAVSYQLQLQSIDYARKRYVRANEYEDEECSFGDTISDFIKTSVRDVEPKLKTLHTTGDQLTFGKFGMEFTLFKFPSTLDLARMMANRGLFLEVLPILRLCLEMVAWSATVFEIKDEMEVIRTRAQKCIKTLKPIYNSVGRVYGYLSKFSHWEQAIHGHFISIATTKIGVTKASARHRAMSLALSLVILDIFTEVIRFIYSEKANGIISGIQGTLSHEQS